MILEIFLTTSILSGITLFVIKKSNKKPNETKSFHKPYDEKWKIQPKKPNCENNIKVKVKEQEELMKYKKQFEKTKEKMLTPTDIAKQLNTSAAKINNIFINLGWIEKKEKWILATKSGKLNGAEEKYNTRSKIKYVVWENFILENEELLSKLKENKKTYSKEKSKTSYYEKVKKGADYEKYVSDIYRERGYNVTEYGKIHGRKDHGIDLIAKKDQEIILIQCKNYKKDTSWKITHKDIKAFQTDARLYVEQQPIFKKYKLTARYTLSNNVLHPSAIKHIEEMQKINKHVDYEIIEICN